MTMTLAPWPIAVTVKIVANDRTPIGKLADAELHFTGGPLDGLKLIGFGIWERRTGGGRNVTFPARQYAVNGERRAFALLRPIADTAAQDKIRSLILDAYAAHEAAQAQPEPTTEDERAARASTTTTEAPFGWASV